MAVKGVFVHDPEKCAGENCCFHNPSEHALSDAPLHVRFDRMAYEQKPGGKPVGYLTERICRHGVGHPDPDSLAFLYSQGAHECEAVHGCDGCCTGNGPV